MSKPLPTVSLEEQQVTAEHATICESEIISGLRSGEQSAWTALYDSYSVRVWRYVARLIGGEANVVADIVQETMLAAARSARNFDEQKGTLWQWLSGIAHHAVSRHWQRESRWQRSLQKLTSNSTCPDSTYELLMESIAAPDARLQQQELADIVRNVLAQLPEDYATLLVAKYVDDLSIAEIQQLHGGTSDAVRSKMVRARTEFRKTFERMTDPE